MDKKRVFILTEGGEGIGFGHITRCTALYEELEKNKIEVIFIIHGIGIEEALKGKKFKNIEWKNTDFLKNLIKKDDYVILDSYLAKKDIYNLVAKLSKKSLYIDDNIRLEYPKGIVLNPSLFGKELKYPTIKGVRYLLGEEFVILRNEFINVKERQQNSKIMNVLITMGGTDIRNLTPKLLEIITRISNEIKIKVITTESFHNLKAIEKKVNKNISVVQNLNAYEMKKAMEESDFVISACGQTVNELLSIGVPFLPIVIIENQEKNGLYLEKNRICNYCHYEDEERIRKYLEKYLKEGLKVKQLKLNGNKKIINTLLEE